MITSRHNPLVKRIRLAMHEHGEEIVIEGPKAVADALAAGWTPIAIVEEASRLAARGLPTSDDDARSQLAGGGEPQAVSAEVFAAISDTRAAQGVLGLFERPRSDARTLLARRDTIVVALDAVQDPGNVGTIVRLAAAFDAAGVILLPGCADPFAPKAIRASVGAILTVPVVAMTIDELLAANLPLFAADGNGAPLAPPSRGAVLLFGNEGRGVSPALAGAATPIAIATSGKVESLNVAASAAILLARSFEARQASLSL